MTIRDMHNLAGWLIVLAVVAGLIAPHTSGVMGIVMSCVFWAAAVTSAVLNGIAYNRLKKSY